MKELDFVKNDDGTYDVVIDTDSDVYKQLLDLAKLEGLTIEDAFNKVLSTMLDK